MSTTNPDYYKNSKGKDLIAEMTERYSKEAFIGFCRGNIEKYVRRFDGKNGIEDLEKAKVYIDRLIEGIKFFDDKDFANKTINVAIEPNFDFDWQKMSIDDLENIKVDDKEKHSVADDLNDEKTPIEVVTDRISVYANTINLIRKVFMSATPYKDFNYFVDFFQSYVDYIEQENKPMYEYLSQTINPNNPTFEMTRLFLMYKNDPDMGQIGELERLAHNIMEYVNEFIYSIYCNKTNPDVAIFSVLSLLDFDVKEIENVPSTYLAGVAADAYYSEENETEAMEEAIKKWER